MGVLVDTVAIRSGETTDQTTSTQQITVANNANRVLVVLVNNDYSGDLNSITGVTANGVSMTLAATENGNGLSDQTEKRFFYLVNPPTGTYNVVATRGSASNNRRFGMAVYSLYNCDVSSPVDDYQSNKNISGGYPSRITQTFNTIGRAGNFIISFGYNGTGGTYWESGVTARGTLSNGAKLIGDATIVAAGNVDVTLKNDSYNNLSGDIFSLSVNGMLPVSTFNPKRKFISHRR